MRAPRPGRARSSSRSDRRWTNSALLPGRTRPRGPASRTVTGSPRAVRASAAVIPTGPAPTTRTGRRPFATSASDPRRGERGQLATGEQPGDLQALDLPGAGPGQVLEPA